jgi:hypothetical protein
MDKYDQIIENLHQIDMYEANSLFDEAMEGKSKKQKSRNNYSKQRYKQHYKNNQQDVGQEVQNNNTQINNNVQPDTNSQQNNANQTQPTSTQQNNTQNTNNVDINQNTTQQTQPQINNINQQPNINNNQQEEPQPQQQEISSQQQINPQQEEEPNTMNNNQENNNSSNDDENNDDEKDSSFLDNLINSVKEIIGFISNNVIKTYISHNGKIKLSGSYNFKLRGNNDQEKFIDYLERVFDDKNKTANAFKEILEYFEKIKTSIEDQRVRNFAADFYSSLIIIIQYTIMIVENECDANSNFYVKDLINPMNKILDGYNNLLKSLKLIKGIKEIKGIKKSYTRIKKSVLILNRAFVTECNKIIKKAKKDQEK